MTIDAAHDPNPPDVDKPTPTPKPASSPLERWLPVAQVLAPSTLVTALFLYFGYVTLTAQYEYFGIDLRGLGLSTTEILLWGPSALYFPLLVITACTLVAAVAQPLGRKVTRSPWWARHQRIVGAAAGVLGVLLVGRGIVGILTPDLAARESPATTPLALASGSILLALVIRGRRRLAARRGGAPVPRSRRWLEIGSLVAIIVLCAFWAANTFAASYGTGLAIQTANSLDDRTEVILDVREPLALGAEEYGLVQRSELNGEPTAQFRYRYTGLRLLAHAGDSLVLAPPKWFKGATVLVVPLDGSLRIQFRPK